MSEVDEISAEPPIIDWEAFAQARSELGTGFIRILGYFREDGVKSLTKIESAMRALDATALVLPAHTLKGEAYQFGATALSALSERIEMIARQCIEWHQTPDELLPDVVRLRPLFESTMTAFERETNPLVERRSGFGRKVEATNQSFGRI